MENGICYIESYSTLEMTRRYIEILNGFGKSSKNDFDNIFDDKNYSLQIKYNLTSISIFF